MEVVGISGYAKSGKDTAAEALMARSKDLWFLRVAFADALKRELAQALNLSVSDFCERLGDPSYKEAVRPLLVEWGRFRRFQRPDYWLDLAKHEIDRLGRPSLWSEKKVMRPSGMPIRIVITDLRYANEADMVRKFGGIVIGVTRPGIGPANAEESASMAGFSPDVTLENSGTVQDLHAAILAVIKEKRDNGTKT